MTDTDDDRDRELDRAAAAIDRGELIVYPTETVYGLGANALDAAAVRRVFSLKDRSREKPVSLAVESAAAASEHTYSTDRERQFMNAFLPGPVTVLLERRRTVPDVLSAGRDRIGVRVPDHDLARELCRRCGPLTATSANRSGEPSVRRVEDLDSSVREGVGAVLDGGSTGGTESTVVDASTGNVVRRGACAEAIERWLADH